MKLHLTSGTPEFMKSVKDKYPQENIYILHGAGNSVLIHETTGKSVFQVPRSYEILDSKGQFAEKGYYVLHHIPLSDEGKPIFEFKFSNLSDTVENEPGFHALRVLKPLKSDTYIILTEWSGPSSYEVWQKKNDFDFKSMEDKQKLFTSAPYTATYSAKAAEES